MADGSSYGFDGDASEEVVAIAEQAHRVEALTLLDHYGLGKALMVQDPPTLTEEDLQSADRLVPHAYALPLTIDQQTTQETSHLVLCNDGRMVVVTRPDDPDEAARYDQYFVRTPDSPRHPDTVQPPQRYYYARTSNDISSLLHFIGWRDTEHEGFITEENTSSFEAPRFERYVGQSMQNAFQLAGLTDERETRAIQRKTQQAFLPRGPHTPPAPDSPPHPNR